MVTFSVTAVMPLSWNRHNDVVIYANLPSSELNQIYYRYFKNKLQDDFILFLHLNSTMLLKQRCLSFILTSHEQFINKPHSGKYFFVRKDHHELLMSSGSCLIKATLSVINSAGLEIAVSNGSTKYYVTLPLNALSKK